MTDTQIQKEDSAGKKFDAGKTSLEMLPPSYWLAASSKLSAAMANWRFYGGKFPDPLNFDPMPVLEFGAVKYAKDNWFLGMSWSRLVGAFHRHVNCLNTDGIWTPRNLTEPDPESGLPHGAHAQCCSTFLAEYNYAWHKHNKTIGTNDCPWAAKQHTVTTHHDYSNAKISLFDLKEAK